MNEPPLPPLKPVPIKDRISVVYVSNVRLRFCMETGGQKNCATG